MIRELPPLKGDNGKEYKVTFQNENLFVEEAGGDVKITVPHIISTFELKDGKAVPVSNSETYVGQKVALVSLRAHDRWYDEEECYGRWENILISAGYAMANHRYVQTNNCKKKKYCSHSEK